MTFPNRHKTLLDNKDYQLVETHKLAVPGLDAERHLIHLEPVRT